MILTGFLFALTLSCCSAATENSDEIPFVVASQGGSSHSKVSNLLPEIEVPTLSAAQSPINRGRGDIEIEEEEQPRGYFYPKPVKPFNLPEFMTLGADEPLVGTVPFAEEVERLPRSPRRPNYRPPGYRPNFPSPPPFVPGFIPPHNIRPLPALYGRPGRY